MGEGIIYSDVQGIIHEVVRIVSYGRGYHLIRGAGHHPGRLSASGEDSVIRVKGFEKTVFCII
jgi:hypothetical protein